MILSYLASRRRQRQAAIPALAHITPSPWRQGWRQLRRNRLAMFCLLLLAVILYTPLSNSLKLAPLTAGQFFGAAGIAAAAVLWYEIVKLIARLRAK